MRTIKYEKGFYRIENAVFGYRNVFLDKKMRMVED
jgi:hypothetical protein